MKKITTQEINELISKKDWAALANSNFVEHFVKNEHTKEIILTEDFCFEFLINRDYLKQALVPLRSSHGFPGSTYFNAIIGQISQGVFKGVMGDIRFNAFLIELYNLVVTEIQEKSDELLFNRALSSLGYFGTQETGMLIKALGQMNNRTRETILRSVNTYYNTSLNDKNLEGVTAEEFKNFTSTLIGLQDRSTFSCRDLSLVKTLELFETKSEMVNFFYHYVHDNGVALADMDPAEFERLIIPTFSKLESAKFNRWLRYYESNPNAPVGDELIEIVSSLWSSDREVSMKRIITNLSTEQLDKMGVKSLSAGIIAKRSDGLDILFKTYGEKKAIDITNVRFYRDDEIAKYPFYFDPRNFKTGALYVSRDTHKLVNKVHGSRTRYNNEWQHFEAIIRHMSSPDITFKNVKYLISKTKPANEDLLTALIRVRNRSSDKVLTDKLNIIIKISNQY